MIHLTTGRNITWCPAFFNARASFSSRVGHQRFFEATTTSDPGSSTCRNPSSQSRVYTTDRFAGQSAFLDQFIQPALGIFLIDWRLIQWARKRHHLDVYETHMNIEVAADGRMPQCRSRKVLCRIRDDRPQHTGAISASAWPARTSLCCLVFILASTIWMLDVGGLRSR